jgi:hypothetical protein
LNRFHQAIEAVVALVNLIEIGDEDDDNDNENESSYLIKNKITKSNEIPYFINPKNAANNESNDNFGVFKSKYKTVTDTLKTNTTKDLNNNNTNNINTDNNIENLNFEDRRNTFLLYKKGFYDCNHHLKLCEAGLCRLQLMSVSQIADMKAVIHEPEILQK